jgi:hypothetical protein
LASFSTASLEISVKNKMNAAVVEQFGKPLVFQEWDIPNPGPGQILVKTEACGVSHGCPCLARRLAVETHAAIHSRP